jgi:hypothetical protein
MLPHNHFYLHIIGYLYKLVVLRLTRCWIPDQISQLFQKTYVQNYTVWQHHGAAVVFVVQTELFLKTNQLVNVQYV